MSNIEKIKAEIKRLKNKNAEWRERINSEDGYSYESDVCCGYDEAIEDFETFINSLPEEKSSEDLNLDKEYNDFVESDPVYSKLVNNIVGKAIARHFAEWGAKHSINWGDVQLLDTFILELSREEKDGVNWGDSEKFYTEVLHRFHEFNNKKIPEIVAEWEAKHLK